MLPDREAKFRTFWLLGAVLLSLISYYLLIYQTPRHHFPSILFYFIILSLVYLLVIRVVNDSIIYWALGGAVLVRLSLLFAVPELSDDFYRFIWDGRLLVQGINPFAHLPSELMKYADFNQVPINKQLFEAMNSPDYFTVYPPLAQWVFYLSAWIFPDSIMCNLVMIRSIIMLFEIGSISLLVKILQAYRLPASRTMIYAWNPLVIIELTGNLHFEAVMIFFVLLAVFLLRQNRWRTSALSLAAGVASKLIPLIFLPLLMFRLPWKKVFGYWAICIMVTIMAFLTIWNPDLINGMSSSLSLYFQKFEFNASIFYLVREIGYAVEGYNIIGAAGKYLALATLVIILLISWYAHRDMSWPKAMVWALTVYLLLTTTVHPWYITPLVALCIFTDYKFPIAWSILVFLSYAGYTETGFDENMVLVVVEYLLLGIVIFSDIRDERKLAGA